VPRSAGHYESFYVKACHPSGGLGVWIRYTVHKRPGAEAKGFVWFTLFDAEAGVIASKAEYPALSREQVSGSALCPAAGLLDFGTADVSVPLRSEEKRTARQGRVSSVPVVRPSVSTSGCDETLQGAVLQGVVGVVVAPQAPDDLAPGAAEDACGVGMARAAGAGAVVDVSRPRVVAAA
jgi:hypothetical protein